MCLLFVGGVMNLLWIAGLAVFVLSREGLALSMGAAAERGRTRPLGFAGPDQRPVNGLMSLLIGLSVIGLLISTYFTAVAYRWVRPDVRWVPSFCRMDEQTCASIVFTPQARLFVLPNSVLGQLYYLAILLGVVFGWIDGPGPLPVSYVVASALTVSPWCLPQLRSAVRQPGGMPPVLHFPWHQPDYFLGTGAARLTSLPETRGDGSHCGGFKTGRLGADDIVISTTFIERRDGDSMLRRPRGGAGVMVIGAMAAAAAWGAVGNTEGRAQEHATSAGVFTEDQAARGKDAYLQECAACHLGRPAWRRHRTAARWRPVLVQMERPLHWRHVRGHPHNDATGCTVESESSRLHRHHCVHASRQRVPHWGHRAPSRGSRAPADRRRRKP